jgi:hypothetical protein
MTTFRKPHRKLKKLLAVTLLLALASLLGACSADDNPVAPAQNDPPREPILYEIQIDLDKIKIDGDCDRDPLIGDANPGEFDYTIEIWARDPNDTYVLEEEIKGSFTKRGGQTYTLDRMENFQVLTGKNYYVGFKATERDGIANDDDYVGYAQDVNKTGGQLDYDHTLTIGDGGCGLTLTYTAKEIPVI